MIFNFIWHKNAEITLQEEASFILKKWNEFEVEKFEYLVVENLDRLSINPEIGIFNEQLKVFYLVISKQTNLYYDFNIETKIIKILLFWNNQKNPDDLSKLL